jgi:hypothetical protein
MGWIASDSDTDRVLRGCPRQRQIKHHDHEMITNENAATIDTRGSARVCSNFFARRSATYQNGGGGAEKPCAGGRAEITVGNMHTGLNQ